MLSKARLGVPALTRNVSLALRASRTRLLSTASTETSTGKREGDISDAFASLAGKQWIPLEPRFASLKRRLIAGHEDAVVDSWTRLLNVLRAEVPQIKERGSAIVPEIDFKDIANPSKTFTAEHKKRGVAVIRGVLKPSEALAWKTDLREYVRANPHTRAFPQDNPQVYELYWSPSQLRARSHPNMLQTQSFLMQHFHSKDPNALLSVQHPVAYADRLRMRQPGDAKFALGPHVDGGSCERWEETGYGRGHVYDSIFRGRWEDYDAWEASSRLPVVSDLYEGVGACSMFRMYQGWLSLSNTGPREGTLLVNPLLGVATSYFMLRPFFSPKQSATAFSSNEDFLHPSNWRLCDAEDSWLQGATPGHGQELRDHLHPHLELESTMVHMPRVQPGDYVAWHCDTIHAVDSVHQGKTDSSVMYIPSCPLTEANAKYLVRQRDCFQKGMPSPDFPGGEGESRHVGRWGVEDIARVSEVEGMRAMGLEAWDSNEPELSPGQKTVMDVANKVLGFYG